MKKLSFLTLLLVISIYSNAQLGISITEVEPLCNGYQTGSITAAPSSGLTPYNYYWSNGQYDQTATGLAAGVYTVTVYDSFGASEVASATISEPSAITVSLSTVDATCGSNGSASAVSSGGVSPYIYSWYNSNSGATSTSETLTGMGDFEQGMLSVTDANGCEVTTFSDYVYFMGSNIGLDIYPQVTCYGGSDAVAATWNEGYISPLTYEWSNGATSETISGLSAGTIGLTITDGIGCVYDFPGTVTEPAPLVINSSVTFAGCGFFDGAISTTITGGNGSNSYLWSNAATTSGISSVQSGMYGLTVTDFMGCAEDTIIGLNSSGGASITYLSHTDVTCYQASDGSINYSVSGGNAPYTYKWYDGAGVNVAALNGSSTAFSLSGDEIYMFEVTDAIGCITYETQYVAEPTDIDLQINTATGIDCFGSSTGELMVVANGGTPGYTYLWNDAQNQNTVQATGLYAGAYAVNVVDANGCSKIGNITLTQPAMLSYNITAIDVTCNGFSDGTLDISVSGGTMPYSYLWATGETVSNISGLTAMNNSITVTDNNGCSFNTTATLVEPTALVAGLSVTDETIINYCDGELSASVSGGTPGYSYLWSTGQTTSNIAFLCAGVYDLSITDNNGCVVQESSTVTYQALPMTITSNVTEVSCNGGIDGSISLSILGGTTPFLYIWNNGETTANITNLSAGSYTYTVTSANGELGGSFATVNEPLAITATVSSSMATCGMPTGSANVGVSGGVSPYTYDWSNGVTLSSNSNISAGSYEVEVTDNNGCVETASTLVTDISGPIVSVLSVTDANCGGADGRIVVGAFGGTTPYTYEWDNGVNGLLILDALPGDHHVLVTDANGCVGAATAVVGSTGGSAPSINGMVTSLLSNLTVTDGVVEVYGYNPYQARMDTIASVQINNDGTYNIPEVLPIGDYVIIAKPNTSIAGQENMVPTYYGTAYHWAASTFVSAGCNDLINADIEVIDLTPLVGTGSIGGILTWDGTNKNGHRAGDPIPGVDIALEQIPGGIIATGQTGSDGRFQFNNVGISASPYGLLVDIPGLDVTQRYENIIVSTEDSVNLDYNFLASDSTIYIATVSGIDQVSEDVAVMALYPNPAKEVVYLAYQLERSSNVKIIITNLLGETVYQSHKGFQSSGKYTVGVDITKLVNSGVYQVQLNTDQGNSIVKLHVIK